MSKLQWVILAAAIGAILLVTALVGWPESFADAGGFASLVGVLLAPASLIILVMTLNEQARTRAQATRDHFLGVQVQALIALIEDDCRILDGMAARNEKNAKFSNVQKRYRDRVAKLNAMVRDELELPAVAAED